MDGEEIPFLVKKPLSVYDDAELRDYMLCAFGKILDVKDDMAYHGCLCPACFSKGIQTILYIRDSKESNEYWDNKLKKRK